MAGTTDFIPARDAELAQYSTVFANGIAADPGAVGLTLAQSGSFAALNDAWLAAYALVVNNNTRTPSAIIDKDNAREAMVNELRALAAIIRAFPDITDRQLSDLGLTVPSGEVTPVPPPSAPPILSIEKTLNRTVFLRLKDKDNPENNGKPEGVAQAIILTYVGDEPPLDTMGWSFFKSTSRTLTTLDLPASLPSQSKLWITAFWQNAKSESGPPAPAISTVIADQVSQAA